MAAPDHPVGWHSDALSLSLFVLFLPMEVAQETEATQSAEHDFDLLFPVLLVLLEPAVRWQFEYGKFECGYRKSFIFRRAATQHRPTTLHIG